MKHQPWVRLPKPSKHDPDLLEARHCSFHGSRRHATLHCWALKRHLGDLIQCGYLEEFVRDQEEVPEVRDTQLSISIKALTHQYNLGREAHQEAMELFSLETILCRIM